MNAENEDAGLLDESKQSPFNRFIGNHPIISGLCVVVVIVLIGCIAAAIFIPLVYLDSDDDELDIAPFEPEERVKWIHNKYPLIDGHNDLPWAYLQIANSNVSAIDLLKEHPGVLDTDIPRIKAGLMGGQFWSVYVSCNYQGQAAVEMQLKQIDIALRMINRYPDEFHLARTTDEFNTFWKKGKLGSFLGMEGGHAINNSLTTLRMFYDLGVRYMTLTHNCDTPWADAAQGGTFSHNGLTGFGKEVIKEMNRLGMLIDISHVSDKVMEDVLTLSETSIIFSHSAARALSNHPRNVPDNVLDMLKDNGGVVMVVFFSSFVRAGLNASDVSISDVIDHIEYIANRVGVDHVGLGSDFDGVDHVLPAGLTDVSMFPNITLELIHRGYSDSDIGKIIGGNVLRVLKEAETTSANMKARGVMPSEALCCF
eukprot:TRINITY_DN7700_c0_g1_i1.p1 TRINITY_DN7700_c0_g1~~TRINITY_DN7700_c0_g1_i1.p1  ORF type:complete len:425 (+),score=78.49 TRINITY_DN7700_c0_g1_i1:86-1360(+)